MSHAATVEAWRRCIGSNVAGASMVAPPHSPPPPPRPRHRSKNQHPAHHPLVPKKLHRHQHHREVQQALAATASRSHTVVASKPVQAGSGGIRQDQAGPGRMWSHPMRLDPTRGSYMWGWGLWAGGYVDKLIFTAREDHLATRGSGTARDPTIVGLKGI